jgi:hypothetical protein
MHARSDDWALANCLTRDGCVVRLLLARQLWCGPLRSFAKSWEARHDFQP